MSLQFSDNRSIYMQIVDHICDNILCGELRPDDRIASVRDMAATIAVNPNTVQRSYTWLQEQQVLVNKRGIGYFVASDAHQKVKWMQRDQFIRKDLPAIFQKMQLLGMTMEDILELYHRQKEQI